MYRFRFLWSRDNLLKEGDDIFTDQSDFGGSLLRVTAVPYAHHVQAHAIPPDREDWGEGNQYEGHYGYEIEMMEEARKILNFEYAVTNPPDQGWGIIQEDYRWSGMVGEVGYGRADIAIRFDTARSFLYTSTHLRVRKQGEKFQCHPPPLPVAHSSETGSNGFQYCHFIPVF